MTKKQIKYISAVILLIASYIYAYFSNSQEITNEQVYVPSPSPLAQYSNNVEGVATQSATLKVVKVIDGDTIELENGAKVRYIGIDTPETVDPRRGVGCFGREASEKNKSLVLGKNVILEKDISETDRYGRLLRYVFVASPETGPEPLMVNSELVKEGYARASSYPPDIKYQDNFLNLEKTARDAKLGLWANCP